jgi:hypothetical protein
MTKESSIKIRDNDLRIPHNKAVSFCDLVVRVLDYRYRGPGFDSRALQGKKK